MPATLNIASWRSAGRSKAALLGCVVWLTLASGLSCRRPSSEAGDRATAGRPAATSRSADPAARVRQPLVTRLAPRGTPSPGGVCGHAVALVGWRPGAAGRDAVLVHDPADNRVSGAGRGEPPHDWRPEPMRLPVRYGSRRPGVTLLPAAAYTIVGAVVVAPVGGAAAGAAAMPDLSQEFPARGPGLCGPTSAADVLCGIAARSPAVLAGIGRGVPPDHEAVASLVLGGDGLAGLMEIAADDGGATTEGIRAGLEAWLERVDPGAWRVAIDWLEDESRSQQEQRRYLERLARSSRGGGVVLCLWPGYDAVRPQPGPAEAAREAARSEAAPAAAQTAADAPHSAADAARAAAEAAERLEAARRSLKRGRPGEAVEAVGRAVAAVRRPAMADAACRRRLDEALALAAEIDRRTAATGPAASDKPTRFE